MAERAAGAGVVDRAQTPLLALITAEAVDRDYQAAAARRPGPGREPARARLAVVLVLGLFATLVTVAAAQTTQNADVDTASRADLVQRVNIRRARVAALQERIAALQTANAGSERSVRALGEQLAALRAREAAVGAVAGFVAVNGPGVRVVVDNPPYAAGNDVLRDSDLTLLANALWEAGAEAVAINGQRLTGAGAIRNVGDAIEVNGVGVAAPYTVLAVGDPRTLAADLVDSASGLQFVALTRRFGFRYTVRNDDAMRLPAAPPGLQRLGFATSAREPKLPGGGTP